MKRINLLITFLCVLPAITAIGAQVVVLNTLVIDGKKVLELEQQISVLEIENKQLELANSKLGTIPKISERAEKLGLKPSKISFVPAPHSSLASNN